MSLPEFEYHPDGSFTLDLTRSPHSPTRQAELETYAAAYGPVFTEEVRELITQAKARGEYATSLTKSPASHEELEEIRHAMSEVINNVNNFDGSYYRTSTVTEEDDDYFSYELHVSWYPNSQAWPIDHPARFL